MSRKSLAEIQSAFQTAVRGTSEGFLAEVIQEKPPISGAARLQIYQDAYAARLTESLRDDFEDCEQNLGSEPFELILKTFIAANPSRSRNLAEYSAAFPDFLGALHPELHQLATQEWMTILSTQAADPQRLLSAEDMQKGREFKLALNPATITKHVAEKALLSYRLAERIHFRELNFLHRRLIEFLSQERTLQEIEEFAQEQSLDELELMTLISDWIENEILYCQGPAT